LKDERNEIFEARDCKLEAARGKEESTKTAARQATWTANP